MACVSNAFIIGSNTNAAHVSGLTESHMVHAAFRVGNGHLISRGKNFFQNVTLERKMTELLLLIKLICATLLPKPCLN
jgi:urease accessory protein UreE